MSRETISEKCAGFITGLCYENLPNSVREMAKYCLLDFLGCTLGGSGTPEGQIIKEFVQENKDAAQATVIGDWKKNSVLNAALANGYLCHILECDDVHKASVLHPGAPVIAAALAVAEVRKNTGKELIEAIVAGYDVMMRTGETVMPSHYYFWHTTATCGGFGAAAAVGKLLRLTGEQLVDALGNAGSQAAGLWEFLEDNAMTKYLHCGKAASNGVLAAFLAEKGFTGAKKIIEGNRGFVKATSSGTSPEEKFASLGLEYKILETSFKPYASCRHTHATVGAVLKLKEKYKLEAAQTDRITVNVYKTALQIARNNEHYEDARAAKFSMVYCAAAALYFGGLPLKAFSKEALVNPEILRLAKNTVLNSDEELNKQYPEKWIARVVIEAGGKTYEELVEYPKGDPENSFTEQDFEDKYLDLATTVLTREKAECILIRCKNLEGISDMSNFFTG